MKLSAIISQYVELKQSMGNKFKGSASALTRFSRLVGLEADITEITSEQVNDFLLTSQQVTPSWYKKYDALHGFYKYAISRQYVRSSPLPTIKPQLPPAFVPYIYTHDELRRLLDATAAFRKNHRILEPHTLRTFLLLLYGAGLRLSEAISLALADVNLSEAIITIRNTKFNKTRFVPLAPQLNQAMVQYLIRRNQDQPSQVENAPFFVGRTGQPLSAHIIEMAFMQLRSYVGIYRPGTAHNQPRLHDLRHSFAVHRLTEWYRQGKDVQRLLPRLATYMGHIEISSTQVYLTMTPELLQEANRRFEQYAFQEVIHD